MNDLYNKLDSDLDVLLNQMHELRITRHIYSEVRAMVEANHEILRPSHFYAWMDHTYTVTMAIGIRRLVDLDTQSKGSVSFYTFLSQIKDATHLLSRDAYKDLYRSIDSDLPESYQDEQFDRLAGVGAAQIDPHDVEREMQRLKTVTASLKIYVNKRIAHYDRDSLSLGPSYKDIEEAFAFLGDLLSRYHQLFRASGYFPGPYIQYDWKQIFRVPWLPDSDPSNQ